MNCDLTVTWFNSRLIVFIDESVVPAVCCFVDHRLSLALCVCVCVCRMGGAERRADDKVNRFVSALPEFALCVC